MNARGAGEIWNYIVAYCLFDAPARLLALVPSPERTMLLHNWRMAH